MKIQSLRDALDAIGYLRGRGKLCDLCGWMAAKYENQFHKRCDTCKGKGAYTDIVCNAFEEHLFQSLREWGKGFTGVKTPGNRSASSDATDKTGNGAAQTVHTGDVGKILPAGNAKVQG